MKFIEKVLVSEMKGLGVLIEGKHNINNDSFNSKRVYLALVVKN